MRLLKIKESAATASREEQSLRLFGDQKGGQCGWSTTSKGSKAMLAWLLKQGLCRHLLWVGWEAISEFLKNLVMKSFEPTQK